MRTLCINFKVVDTMVVRYNADKNECFIYCEFTIMVYTRNGTLHDGVCFLTSDQTITNIYTHSRSHPLHYYVSPFRRNHTIKMSLSPVQRNPIYQHFKEPLRQWLSSSVFGSQSCANLSSCCCFADPSQSSVFKQGFSRFLKLNPFLR